MLDESTGTIAFQLGDQGSFVRFVGVAGWKVWTVNNKGIRVFTAECLWREDIKKVCLKELCSYLDDQLAVNAT